MPGSNMTSASIESSNVVSAGLAAGLGVNMAAAALANCLPGGPSGLGSLTEPRFARTSISGPSGTPLDLSAAIGRSFHLTESQLNGSETVSPIDSMQSDRPNFEDRPVSAHAEADLARRRTTGGLAAGRERTPGKHGMSSDQARTHRRSGTHDPRGSTHNPSRPFDSSGSASARSGIYGAHGSSFAGTSIAEDEHSYSQGGAGYASVSGSESTSGHSNGAQASGRGSTLADTPSLGNKAMLSPDAQSRGSYLGDGGPGPQLRGYGPAGAARGDEQALGALAIGLAGMSGGGHFGPQVRAKIAGVLDTLLAGVPLLESAGETVSIAEYGSLNSRSTPLLPHVISRLAERAHARRPQQAAAPAPSSDGDLLGHPRGLAADRLPAAHAVARVAERLVPRLALAGGAPAFAAELHLPLVRHARICHSHCAAEHHARRLLPHGPALGAHAAQPGSLAGDDGARRAGCVPLCARSRVPPWWRLRHGLHRTQRGPERASACCGRLAAVASAADAERWHGHARALALALRIFRQLAGPAPARRHLDGADQHAGAVHSAPRVVRHAQGRRGAPHAAAAHAPAHAAPDACRAQVGAPLVERRVELRPRRRLCAPNAVAARQRGQLAIDERAAGHASSSLLRLFAAERGGAAASGAPGLEGLPRRHAAACHLHRAPAGALQEPLRGPHAPRAQGQGQAQQGRLRVCPRQSLGRALEPPRRSGHVAHRRDRARGHRLRPQASLAPRFALRLSSARIYLPLT
ncbi:hypothetical protein FA09DRAFT_255825 [Tilletiopsis washingtonensis]|uniref:Uncharacterized protein n=1 Tax=Tilletiopsis washingtonensis TaxID=58919 RepID=A0A316ZBD1_9BASI|nr:hypothetical protein FA09DRAFT_255825 [Tilletiopsis washingtonensis]PWN98849.1 hypothetical protein FA09DRAFT_255825 [Tilletiopsis washingtonensis]